MTNTSESPEELGEDAGYPGDLALIVGSTYRHSARIDQLVAALAAAQGDFEAPLKDNTAEVPMKAGGKYSYKYTDLASVIAASRGPLSRNGLALMQPASVTRDGDRVRVTVTTFLAHASGQWFSSDLIMISESTTPQAIGTAMAYGRRYGRMALVDMAGEDDDGAEASGAGREEKLQGPISEFDFAITKGETKPPFGKPAEYWDLWRQGRALNLLRPITKTTRSGQEFDAWEVDSIDALKAAIHDAQPQGNAAKESGPQVVKPQKHPEIVAGEARTQSFLSEHGDNNDAAKEKERQAVRLKQDAVIKALGATTDHIFDFYRGYFGDPLPKTLSGSACLDALDRLTASAEDIRGNFSKDPRTIGQNMKAHDVLKKMSQSGTREGPQPQSTTGLEEQLKASIAVVEGKAKHHG